MDGLELIRQVKPLRPHLAMLILSGHSSFDHAVAAMRVGADDYLTKPFDPDAVLEKASTLMAADARASRGRAQVVLAVGAHPDDVEIGIGGILLRHVAQGHRVVLLTLTGGEAGGVAVDRAAECGARRRAALRAAHPRGAGRHERQRGRHDDRHDRRRHRRDPPDDRLHPHQPRRPPGPPQRAQRHARRRPRDRARLLLPGAVHDRRVHADAVRRHRRVPGRQDRGHPGLHLAGQGPPLPRRGAAAGHRPLLVAVRAGALRGAARGRARQPDAPVAVQVNRS